MRYYSLLFTSALLTLAIAPMNGSAEPVADDVISAQREALAKSTDGAGFGPQSPRDIGVFAGSNTRSFEAAPPFSQMNLCNIHFHESAEHKGGEFDTYAGNGDGKGSGTGSSIRVNSLIQSWHPTPAL